MPNMQCPKFDNPEDLVRWTYAEYSEGAAHRAYSYEADRIHTVPECLALIIQGGGPFNVRYVLGYYDDKSRLKNKVGAEVGKMWPATIEARKVHRRRLQETPAMNVLFVGPYRQPDMWGSLSRST